MWLADELEVVHGRLMWRNWVVARAGASNRQHRFSLGGLRFNNIALNK
jgi:hypothetical protein